MMLSRLEGKWERGREIMTCGTYSCSWQQHSGNDQGDYCWEGAFDVSVGGCIIPQFYNNFTLQCPLEWN